MKRFTKILSLALVLGLTLLFSCSKDKDNSPSGSHKVVFKAIGSTGVSISNAVYVDGSGKTETFTSLTGETWTSNEYTVDASAHAVSFGVSGTGPNAASTLVVEIWVDGVKKADGKSTGTILSPSASYSF
ncbi:hypothetical protein [Pedobacter sp. MC2016-24]|uniref:hypothetical protein n=1 Tax=Pedobacter sp. MC2016-24 TaxID=2780090 RepID=UPI00187FAB0F|nr:hypothetical protein [Pedobacter sp. MC2016-24]MBE9599676.1 hypothetical protein [Pedobacter sp. MC2016-24]